MTTNNRIFGHIPGIAEGSTFASYEEMNKAKIHAQTQAGISGSQNEGADSIIISGGYEDDQDYWDTIVYTGQGGQNPSGKHIADQKLSRGNLALVKNELEGLPIRVIRGKDRKNPYAPAIGYRYDGLYRVDSHWSETGKSGFLVWRYRLVRFEDEALQKTASPTGAPITVGTNTNPVRKTMIVQRIVRDTKEGKKVKQLYEWTCQVCGIKINTTGGYYAEAAHVRALGAPHNGPDTSDNIICLCPNHHVMFDQGTFAVNDDLSLIGIDGNLIVNKKHSLSIAHFQYHREHFHSRKSKKNN